jgi:hypothetical protein
MGQNTNGFYFPELSDQDFELCETKEQALTSRAFKFAVHNIIHSLENQYKEANNYYKMINSLVDNTDDINNYSIDDLKKLKDFIIGNF